MNLRRLLIATLAAAFSLTSVSAFAGDETPKAAVKRGTAVKEAAPSKKDPVVAAKKPRFWRRSSEQPCDSSACRPFRFAWSPVAPGA
jgi:hypothetical protein